MEGRASDPAATIVQQNNIIEHSLLSVAQVYILRPCSFTFGLTY